MLRDRGEAGLLRHVEHGALRVPLTSRPREPLDTAAIWHDFHRRLLAFISRRVPDRDAAEDVLQEVMLRIHRHAGELEDSQRLVRGFIRSPATRSPTTTGAQWCGENSPPASSSSDRPESERRSDELRRELAACLGPLLERLPAPYREAITLTELEGLTQAGAAARLGVSTSGMKSRVQRGRVQLREQLVGCCEIELDRRGAITGYRAAPHPVRLSQPDAGPRPRTPT